MKLFKRLAGACLALTLCCGMAGMAACGDKGGNNNSSTSSSNASSDAGSNVGQANAYNFEVYTAENEPAVGYYVQMCTTDTPAICYQPVAIGADGKVSISQNNAFCPAEAVYEVHILNSEYEPVDTTETVYTPANFSAEYIVITLA